MICAVPLPETIEKRVPSVISASAALAASPAACTPRRPIEPDVSMRMTSAAEPGATGAAPEPAAEAPVEVTRTMACRSVPPSGRNSFWNTSVGKSAIDRSPFIGGGCLGSLVRVIRSLSSQSRKSNRDVVAPPLLVGEVDERLGEHHRLVTDPGGLLAQQVAQVLRLRAVVPQAVGADHEPAARGSQRRQVRCEVIGRVLAE